MGTLSADHAPAAQVEDITEEFDMKYAWIALASAILSAVPGLRAQINAAGTFSGRITDPSGAGVANAQVKITNQATGVTNAIQPRGDGFYTAPFMKPGLYSIEVTAQGFAPAVRRDLSLQVQQVVQQDFRLKVGEAKQEVTVQGGAPLLNTESTEVGNVLEERAVQHLPLNGRNFAQLGLLVPGTTPGPEGGIRQTGGGNETARAGAEITTSGGRGTFNLFMIDGIDDRDQSVGTLKVFPNLESIAEFKVQVGNSDAEFATGGAVVNV
ncbi:MAG: carboxypeptidase-like regulatory domain-containing protein, partial [Bryobacteraceae bacterium]